MGIKLVVTPTAKGAQIFQKSRGHFKTIGFRMVTWSKVRIEDLEILGGALEKLFTQDLLMPVLRGQTKFVFVRRADWGKAAFGIHGDDEVTGGCEKLHSEDIHKLKCWRYNRCIYIYIKIWTRECWRHYMDHPLYNPDLGPCDFHLFGHLKQVTGHRFATDVDVKQAVTS